MTPQQNNTKKDEQVPAWLATSGGAAVAGIVVYMLLSFGVIGPEASRADVDLAVRLNSIESRLGKIETIEAKLGSIDNNLTILTARRPMTSDDFGRWIEEFRERNPNIVIPSYRSR